MCVSPGRAPWEPWSPGAGRQALTSRGVGGAEARKPPGWALGLSALLVCFPRGCPRSQGLQSPLGHSVPRWPVRPCRHF